MRKLATAQGATGSMSVSLRMVPDGGSGECFRRERPDTCNNTGKNAELLGCVKCQGCIQEL